MSSNLNDPTVIRTRGAARDVQAIAEAQGWSLPEETQHALEMAKEAKVTARTISLDTTPPPTKPAGIAKWIAAEAARRQAHREQQQVGQELADRLDLEALRSLLACARDLTDHIVAKFPEALERLTSVLPLAPAEVTGRTTADEFTAFAAAAQAADIVSLAAQHRNRLAQILNEDAVTGVPLWLVLNPSSTASLFAVSAVLRDLKGSTPTTVEEWRSVLAIGVKMAAPGEADRRIETHSRAVYNSGMSKDGGMLDKTYTEALGSEFGAAALIAGQPGAERW